MVNNIHSPDFKNHNVAKKPYKDNATPAATTVKIVAVIIDATRNLEKFMTVKLSSNTASFLKRKRSRDNECSHFCYQSHKSSKQALILYAVL